MQAIKTAEYESLKSSIPVYNMDRIAKDRLRIRPDVEAQYDDSRKIRYARESESFDRTYDNVKTDIERIKMKVDL